MTRQSSLLLARLGLAVVGVLPLAANAADFEWDFQNTTFTNSFTEVSLAGGGTIGVRAYSTTSNDGNWASSAQFTNQLAAGIGIQNFQQAVAESAVSLPEGAIDTRGGATDIVVIDAGVGRDVNWTSLIIGYGQDYNNGGNFQDGSRADLLLYSGNTIDFNTVCFSGCGAGSLTGVGSLNFNTATLNDTAINTDRAVALAAPSRYLIIAGAVNDAFSLKGISGASKLVPNGVPEPASLALVGLGLLGLGFSRRRKTKA